MPLSGQSTVFHSLTKSFTCVTRLTYCKMHMQQTEEQQCWTHMRQVNQPCPILYRNFGTCVTRLTICKVHMQETQQQRHTTVKQMRVTARCEEWRTAVFVVNVQSRNVPVPLSRINTAPPYKRTTTTIPDTDTPPSAQSFLTSSTQSFTCATRLTFCKIHTQ